MPSNVNELNSSDVVDVQRPFPGLQSFQEKNKSQFGGRDKEIKELHAMVEKGALTLVFGKSGIGKTSLLQAGLLPELQKNFFLPIYIRIDYSSSKSPLSQLKSMIFEKIRLTDKTVPEFHDLTLWEYFHELKLLDGMLTPVVLLDQFEETFTIGKQKNHEVNELMTELSDLVENHVPLVVQKDYQQRTEMISSNYGEQHYHVVLSLREDYLPQLESLRHYLPSMKNNRYRVVQMTVQQAMDAAIKPGKGLIDQNVAAAIIKKLPGVTERDFDILNEDQDNVNRFVVEPFLLSLICFRMNEKRIELGLEKFTLDLVSQFNISDIIASHYNEAMKNFDDIIHQGIENELLTESGFRKLETFETLKTKYQINEQVIQTLIDKRIVRKEERGGVEYVELIHDVLAPVIKNIRDQRLIAIHEKDKKLAIQKAIEIDRIKRKRLLQIAAAILLPIISLVFYYAKIRDAEAKRLANLEFAQQLLLVTKNVSTNYGDLEGSALFSRTAYMMFKENNGKNLNPFYKDMYKRMEDFGMDFRYYATTDPEVKLKSIALIDNDIYTGYSNGKIYQSAWNDSSEVAHKDFNGDYSNKVTNLSKSKDNKYLAACGIFHNILLFDLSLQTVKPVIINPPFQDGNKKSICLTDDMNLFLRTDTNITSWNLNENNKLYNWAPRKQFTFKNNKWVESPAQIDWNKNTFSMPGINFHSIASYKNTIAIGIQSGFILINRDSTLLFKNDDVNQVISIQFDPQGNYLYLGNVLGALYRLTLANFQLEKNQSQISRISEIACSSNGKYIATACSDGSVGIYPTENMETWKNVSPLVLSVERCDGSSNPVNAVAFSPDERFVLAGYDNGIIYRWPVNSDVLSDLICQSAQHAILDTVVWNKFTGKQITPKELDHYKCPN